MFDNLKRKIENLQNELKQIDRERSISIPILPDSNGYLDRECPNPDCLFQFKVQIDDWRNLFRDEQVFCPMCRHEAKSNHWFNSEQLQEGKKQITQHLRKRILNAWSGTRIYGQNFLPITAREEMTLKIECEECHSRYSVIGSAYFCPCCGHNSVEKTFDESLNKVEAKLNNLLIVRKAIEASSKDEAEIICRSFIETALSDCVVAFQRFCEVTYTKQKPTERLPLNVFQRLGDGSKLWNEVFNEGYEDWLTERELDRMKILFQRRHLLLHTEGLVDDKYLQRTNDSFYKLGQRIVVKENDISELLKLIRKVITKIREKKTE